MACELFMGLSRDDTGGMPYSKSCKPGRTPRVISDHTQWAVKPSPRSPVAVVRYWTPSSHV